MPFWGHQAVYERRGLRSPPAQRSSWRRSDFRCAAIRSPVVWRVNAVSNAVDYAKFRRSITSRCDSRLRFRFPKSNNSAHFARAVRPICRPRRRSSFPRSFDQRLGQIPQRAAPRGRGGGHNRFQRNSYDREQARVRGEIRTKSVNVRGTVEGNIFVTERCELQANCTVRGDIEAPRLVVSENATFLGSAKVGTGKSLPA